ncbi:Nucleotide excision repair protein, with UvrB/UvrC motif [Bacillus mojavensis]|uniref:Nucleotide excision repair protein, with UvrB/UvrC motif n=2 Tax=Bacillus mojavensis TaxID=72360 RepID=A0ABX6LRW5_BACMO|nr:Nucleotide excision repair protein, with UvrB/UvrC motif [Bacillus mojavensis]
MFSHSEQISACPKCGMTFQQFRKTGRFGCAECYKTFHSNITPILRKVHSGNTVHGGKIPKRIGGNLHVRRQIEMLKKELEALIHQEEFENAAHVRDQIRSLEQSLKSTDSEEEQG